MSDPFPLSLSYCIYQGSFFFFNNCQYFLIFNLTSPTDFSTLPHIHISKASGLFIAFFLIVHTAGHYVTVSGMIPSILCYVPPSVEPLGPTTPTSFQTRTHDPQFSNQIDTSALT